MDNHDVERIASKLNNKAHLPLVTMLLYTIYGIPSVYYGSEFGLEGKKERGSDWNLRPSLDLSDYEDALQENVLTKLCKQLGFLKKNYSELTDGLATPRIAFIKSKSSTSAASRRIPSMSNSDTQKRITSNI